MTKNDKEPFFPLDRILERFARRVDKRLSRGIGKQLFNDGEKK